MTRPAVASVTWHLGRDLAGDAAGLPGRPLGSSRPSRAPQTRARAGRAARGSRPSASHRPKAGIGRTARMCMCMLHVHAHLLAPGAAESHDDRHTSPPRRRARRTMSTRVARSVAARSVAARSIAAAARGTRRSSSSALRLGDLQLKSDVLLAPLERVSDVGFRRLCFRHGAALTWTEMVYASDLARGKTASCDLIDTHDPSTLTGVQILVDRTTARDGWGVDCLRAALEALEAGAAGARPEWRNIRAIDLNFGCPDPAVSARGAGPAQLRRRSKVQRSRERRRTYHHGAGFGVTMES